MDLSAACAGERAKALLKGSRCMTESARSSAGVIPLDSMVRPPADIRTTVLQLREKQKLEEDLWPPGVPVPWHFERAERQAGVTGDTLLRSWNAG